MKTRKYVLSENEIPRQWYNIVPDLPTPMLPVLHPGTRQPITPDDLSPIFPMEIIKQEASQERWIDIPEQVLDIYRLWRPAPLYRARNLEKLLDTPAKIYYKYEGVSPAGSHKPNTSVAQAYYNKIEGVKRITTETGAGQWGSALSLACTFFGIECKVYMVRVSFEQKPYRRSMIMNWGATVLSSPSDHTEAGRKILAQDPDTTGSLGIAISEAVEEAVMRDDTKYSLGSVLNHVLLHQTIIGLEAQKQMELAGDYPDIVIGCVGGGSNFGGIAFPFLREKFQGKKIQAIAVEPHACPTITRGHFAYDFGDTAQMTPLMAMYTLGHSFIPPGIHAGGLRYHGMAPLISHLVREKQIEPRAYHQLEVFEAAFMFSRSEGIIPAPESSHAIRGAIDEALKAKVEGTSKTILFNLSGHGHFDMSAYDAFLAGKLQDYALPEEELDKAYSVIQHHPSISKQA
ncbi:MAG: TrpB-like pyridoxal phosphate-dependent enzyme [Candidatus Vecturithrix sp.]|jgi:tryptophan synthase beta chain|nr:TrpB-like pyridoxal phosphate-dependent enzyme [Candidatus Vecturithrix sp.]